MYERVDEGTIGWKDFKLVFLDHFFPIHLREAKITEFINFKQNNMSVREYTFKFIKLSKYASSFFADPCARMSKFISEIFGLVIKECQTAMLLKEINISWLITYAENIEDDKIKERKVRESKRAWFKCGFFNARASGESGPIQGKGSFHAPIRNLIEIGYHT